MKHLSNFTRAIHTQSQSFRVDDEEELITLFNPDQGTQWLARGNGLSYSDCCLHDKGVILDTTRLNHILSFDPESGIAVCQGAVTFADLFLLDQRFIPPVLPGTLFATLAGGIANDIHGKNNPVAGSLGHHIEWIDIQINDQLLRCSRTENSELFFATLGGLGLTGMIKRLAIRLTKTSRWVSKVSEQFTDISSLLQRMQAETDADYQVAWLDLLNTPRAVLSSAHSVEPMKPDLPIVRNATLPLLPISLINKYTMKQFNKIYYHRTPSGAQVIPLWQYNNPLDAIKGWNRLYGRKGLVQFQAVFATEHASQTLADLFKLIHLHQATPTLSVLKYFSQPGAGLLSFVQPGFTIAIDFIHNSKARLAIAAMNQRIADIGGKVYLAKDLFLTREQFVTMYPQHEAFSELLTTYKSPMNSDLGKRLLNR